jgi:VWFA-related protein
MSPTRIALLISLLAIATQRAAAQQPSNVAPAAAQSPATPADDSNQPVATIQATARLVVLDVVVVDANGNPVKGLKQSDFTLTENGTPQILASFKEYNTSTSASEVPQSRLPLNTFAVQRSMTEDQTKTVIVLDNLPVGDAPTVRDDIQTFMKTVAPGNPIAICRIDWQGVHMVQDFTADPKVLQEASVSKRILPPLGFHVRYAFSVGSPTRKLAQYVSAIPGRVNLIWLTSAADAPNGQAAFPNLSSVVSNLDGPTRVLRLSRVALYPVSVEGAVGRDISAGAVTNRIFANSHMQELATAAGGHAYFNGIPQALTQIVATGDDYYTLSYVPTNPDWNGAYRNIHIDIAGYPQPTPPESLKGFWSKFLGWTEDNPSKVIYRQGYFARSQPSSSPSSSPVASNAVPSPSPRKLISESLKDAQSDTSMLNAMRLGTLPSDQVDFTIAVTPSSNVEKLKHSAPLPATNYLTPAFRDIPHHNYQVHYRINPHSLRFSKSADGTYRDDLQFVTVCYRDDGLIAHSLTSTLHIKATEAEFQNMLTSGLSFDQTLAMPVADNPVPGYFFLRAGVNEASTGHIGALEIPTEWIKLPAQATGNNTAANSAPSNTLPQ